MIDGSPLCLGTQLTITRGQVLQFGSKYLAPLVSVPYEIHSIRMCAYPSINGSIDCSLRGFLKWQFSAGKNAPLTDSFVPMWCLTPVRQRVTELGGYFEWRFRSPLLLSPAQRIDAQVSLAANTPNAGVTPITVAVAYAGVLRKDYADNMPATTEVPYCSAWDTTLTGSSCANDWNSLRNPLSTPVDVHSLILRVENDSTGVDGDSSKTVQIMDPRGYALSPNGPVKLHAFAPTDSREFPYTGRLMPNQHFSVRLTDPPTTAYQPQISYLGSRREATP